MSLSARELEHLTGSVRRVRGPSQRPRAASPEERQERIREADRLRKRRQQRLKGYAPLGREMLVYEYCFYVRSLITSAGIEHALHLPKKQISTCLYRLAVAGLMRRDGRVHRGMALRWEWVGD